MPQVMEPVEQINSESYIGLALKHLDKGKGVDHRGLFKLE